MLIQWNDNDKKNNREKKLSVNKRDKEVMILNKNIEKKNQNKCLRRAR